MAFESWGQSWASSPRCSSPNPWGGSSSAGWTSRTCPPALRLLLLRLSKALVVIPGILIALDQLGLQIAPLVAGLGVAGLGIGPALRGVLSNVVAGLSIMFTKPYRVGEHVSLLGGPRRCH